MQLKIELEPMKNAKNYNSSLLSRIVTIKRLSYEMANRVLEKKCS